jgi:GTPase SAR1 family protein
MTEYSELKKKIEQRVEVLAETIQELESRGIVEEQASARWKEQLVQVRSSLEDPLLRIAVVGTVKSGKSTLINALVGKDLLKRGAGIITAFITRLITHGETEGWVELKPWPQVLDELNASLRMIPHCAELLDEDHSLDIRLAEDRNRIEGLLARMRDEWRQKDGLLDPGHLILHGYLDGYDRVQQFIRDEPNRLHFDQHSLDQHQHYVGSEGQAVYLRDMELHYSMTWLGESIELADCQGIDSPNPLHFALLQQYLLKSHLILYVISSRSGLREADFRLINFIRTLKMLPQTFFVLNADLDDHPHLLDLKSLADRVRSELSWVVRDPRFFTFSALYHLVAQLEDSASAREHRHLQLWQEETSLVHFTEEGFSAFRESLSQVVCGQRLRVLCGSGLSRLSVVAGSVMDTAAAQRMLLDHTIEDIRQTAEGLKDKQGSLLGSLETLKNAISGLRGSLCDEIDRVVDAFFDPARSRIISETLDVVENYPIHFEHEKALVDYRWLFHQFHRLYREFRQSLARYLVEKVNLQLIEFAKKEEAFLCERLRRGAQAFWTLFAAALEDYRRETGLFVAEQRAGHDSPETDWQIRGLVAPPNFTAFVDQGAIGRGILLMKLGLAGFTRLLGDYRSRMGKDREVLLGGKKHESMSQEAIKLLKKEAKRELVQAFGEYRNQFKSHYLQRIVDDETGRLLQEFDLRAAMVQVNLGDLLQRRQTEGDGRESLVETLTQAHQISQAMIEELEELRCTLD